MTYAHGDIRQLYADDKRLSDELIKTLKMQLQLAERDNAKKEEHWAGLIRYANGQAEKAKYDLKQAEQERDRYKTIYKVRNEMAKKYYKANTEMLEALVKTESFIGRIMSFYGLDLQVIGWHQNNDAEPWDNFFDNNMAGDELELIQSVLSRYPKGGGEPDESNRGD